MDVINSPALPPQVLCLANAVSFQITRFTPDLSAILYRGDAIASVGEIEFNNVDYLYQINLKEILPQWAAVGFSAATCPYVERHTLESWEFSSNLDIAKTRGSKAKKIGLVADLTAAGAILIVGRLIVIEALRRNKQSATANLEMAANSTTSTNDDLEKGAGLFWVESQY
nr:L-type lectin-domain containing receptor kinase IX.1-like [Coffea arabica]